MSTAQLAATDTVAVSSPIPGTPGRSSETRLSKKQKCFWGGALFITFLVAYLAVGYYLYLVIGYINPDASSRVGNAGYTIMSRFPHLGAIGFVWNPLPSLVEIPLLKLSAWWAPMKTVGFAGAVMSAVFMAGAVWQTWQIAWDCRVSRVARWLGVAAFALNPMVILYAGMGMSEAPFLFLLLWACRRVLRWVRTANVADLAWAGVALGLAYLTRYEAVVAGVAVAGTVFWVTIRRLRATRGLKPAAALGAHDAVLVSFPLIGAFVLWALIGGLLDGSPFAQFTSQYGNSAQVNAAGIASADTVGFIPLVKAVAANLFGIQPLLLVVAVAVLVFSVYRRNIGVLVPVAVFGSVLFFQSFAVVTGATFGWFRFFMTAIPLVVIALFTCWRVPQNASAKSQRTQSVWRPSRWATVLLAGVLVTSIPVTWQSMLNPAIGQEEFGLRSAISPDKYPKSEFWFYWFGDISENTVGWLDQQNLSEGSVVIDTFGLSRMWLSSDKPEQFVVRSDLDFFDKLNNPAEEGVRYFLVRPPTGLGALDVINVRYPTMWDDGAGLASLTMTVNAPDGRPQFRIYQIAT